MSDVWTGGPLGFHQSHIVGFIMTRESEMEERKTISFVRLILFLWLRGIFSHYVKNSWGFEEDIFHKKELRDEESVLLSGCETSNVIFGRRAWWAAFNWVSEQLEWSRAELDKPGPFPAIKAVAKPAESRGLKPLFLSKHRPRVQLGS